MGCLNRIYKKWPDKHFVQGKEYAGGKGREGSFQVKLILQALLAALTALPSALSLVLKTIPRSLMAECFTMVWVLGGLWDERVGVTSG